MKQHLHIDIETFSSVDITTCGSYKYFESPDFEILIICYAFGDGPIQTIDMTEKTLNGVKEYPLDFAKALADPTVELHAHNANFERNAFWAAGFHTDIERWHCSAVKALLTPSSDKGKPQ